MGKHSNIILLNGNDIIIDSLRHLDSTNNSTRDILPAHPYELPSNTKLDLLNIRDFNEFYTYTKDLTSLDSGLSDTFSGISKLFIQNIINELNINNEVNRDNLSKLYDYIVKVLVQDVYFKAIGKDYTITLMQPLNQENEAQTRCLNFLIDDFYTEKENTGEFLNYRNTILKLVSGTLKKITKKLNNINAKLKECSNKEIYQLYGELITANMYKYKEFDSDYIEVENYYDNNKMIRIPVDKKLSPSINAKNYYKKYNKLKNALEIVNKQKLETVEEIDYVETIIFSIENCKTISDIDEIYTELKENDLFFNKKNSSSKNVKSSKMKNKNKKADKEYIPIEYKIDNYTFFVGKNNKQNDYLSTKILKHHDMWFHTKDIHGSHGILLTNNTTPPMDVIIKCAQIVAYYSKARQSSNVPVDYTFGKFVKKPSNSKPGFVIYTHNSTVNVNPKLD